jgi:hypothetical protein
MKTIFATIGIFIIVIGGAGYLVKDQNIPLLSMVGQDISTKILGQKLPLAEFESTADPKVTMLAENSSTETQVITDTNTQEGSVILEDSKMIQEVVALKKSDEVTTQTTDSGKVSLQVSEKLENTIDTSFIKDKKNICEDIFCIVENLNSCLPSVLEMYEEFFVDAKFEITGSQESKCNLVIYGYNQDGPFDQKVSSCLFDKNNSVEEQFNLFEDNDFLKNNCTQRDITPKEFSQSKSTPKEKITMSCGQGQFGDTFIKNLSTCSNFSCQMRLPGFDMLGARNILGYEGDKCLTEEITNGLTVECQYSPEQLAKMTASYEILQAGGSVNDTDYFFYEAQADGACITIRD